MTKRTVKKYNWTKIRNEYVRGYVSMDKLCKKYDVPYNTMLSRSNKNNEWWTEQRREYRKKINERAIDNVIEKEATEIQNMKEKERKQVAVLEQAALGLLIKNNNINTLLTAQDIAAISVVLERCQKMKYKSFGISDNVSIKGEVIKKELQEIRIISDETIEESIKILSDAGVVNVPAKDDKIH